MDANIRNIVSTRVDLKPQKKLYKTDKNILITNKILSNACMRLRLFILFFVTAEKSPGYLPKPQKKKVHKWSKKYIPFL